MTLAKKTGPSTRNVLAIFYLDANGITESDKKRAVFLSVVGPSTYRLLINLVSPDKLGEKSFADLVKLLTMHHNPTPSETIQRFKFHSRIRKTEETVATYVSELRSITEYCNFGSTLDECLGSFGVWRKQRHHTKQAVEAKQTFTKAMELSHGLESAARNAKELKPPSKSDALDTVHKVMTEGKDGFRSVSCHRCGGKGHKAPSCRFKNAKCHHCGKVCHLKRACRSKGKPTRGKEQQVHCLEEESDEAEEYTVLHLGSETNSPPVKVDLLINEKPLCMEVDAGVAQSIVSETTFRELWPTTELSPSKVQLRTCSGEALFVLGTLDVHVEYKEQSAQLSLLVVQGNGPRLFGWNWLL